MNLGPRSRRILAALIDLPMSLLFMLAGLAAALLSSNWLDAVKAPPALELIVVYAMVLGPHAAFYILLTGYRGSTTGKAIMHLMIVDAAGTRPSYGLAAKRYLGQLLADLLFGLGHLPAIIRDDRRSLADLLAGTSVVDTTAVASNPETGAAPSGAARPMSPLLRSLAVAGAILGTWLLAMSAVRFGQLLQYSKEGATKGNLNSIRSAISIYYGDTEGSYPQSLSTAPDSVFSRYLEKLPAVTATHAGIGKGRKESPAGNMVTYTINETITITGQGWRYNPASGHIYVNSCATDMKGLPYSCYGY